jgi:phosphonate transport system permease protein
VSELAAEYELGAAERPDRPRGEHLRRVALLLTLLVAVVWSISGLDISLSRLKSAPGDAWDIFVQMFPPDFSGEIERGVLGKVRESVYIAWIGTIIAALISFPLSFFAANNVAPVWIQLPMRQLFNAIRAVPELIVAVILLGVTGLGPWAGALAIGLHSVGTLGKLSMEAIESVDQGPTEAVQACGGRWISGMRWGILPEVLPIVISYWLFRFEINVRVSAVLGMIGAGGVGAELVQQLNFRNFEAVGAVLVITIVVVITIDTISAAVRRRIIHGGGPAPEASREMEALSDLTGLGA